MIGHASLIVLIESTKFTYTYSTMLQRKKLYFVHTSDYAFAKYFISVQVKTFFTSNGTHISVCLVKSEMCGLFN